jgi:PAS domain S-box-containing protein
MANDGASLQATRLRDGLRLVSTVTAGVSRAPGGLAEVARAIAAALPDACGVELAGEAAVHDPAGQLGRLALHVDAPVLHATPDGLAAPLRAAGITSLIAAPLAVGLDALGTLWLARRGAFDALDLEIVSHLAGPLALAIAHARRAPADPQHEDRVALVDAIVENIPAMVFLKDADRLAFVRFNRAGEDLLGLSRAELIGKTDHDLFPADEAAFFVAKDREALQGSAVVEIAEEPIATRRGPRWLHTKKVPLRDGRGVPRYLLGISHDITERKRQLAELSAAKADADHAVKELESFSYSVAHDLRTPLRAIDGFSQALLEEYGDRLDGEGRRYLDRVRGAAQRMAELIDDLLTLSRVTRSDLKRSRVDLSALARALLATLARLEPERGVQAVIAPDVYADADPQLAAIALDNLLGNAWKFTSKRRDARIELGQRADGAYFVRDNGAGFDMAYRDKLFGVFQRLHPEVDYPGTGIGLATVARITERHGGRIWAESTPGEGATFYFTLTEAHA